MNYFDSDMAKSTNNGSILWLEDCNLYLRLQTMLHTIYAAKFINMYIYEGKVSHMNWRMC